MVSLGPHTQQLLQREPCQGTVPTWFSEGSTGPGRNFPYPRTHLLAACRTEALVKLLDSLAQSAQELGWDPTELSQKNPGLQSPCLLSGIILTPRHWLWSPRRQISSPQNVSLLFPIQIFLLPAYWARISV